VYVCKRVIEWDVTQMGESCFRVNVLIKMFFLSQLLRGVLCKMRSFKRYDAQIVVMYPKLLTEGCPHEQPPPTSLT